MLKLSLLALVVLSFFSCGNHSPYEGLKLPPTPVLTVQTYYGVVDFAYIRVRDDARSDAALVTMLRGGTIVEIVTSSSNEETIEGKTNRWYQISFQGRRGWVFGSYLKIFDSLDKARNAAKSPVNSKEEK